MKVIISTLFVITFIATVLALILGQLAVVLLFLCILFVLGAALIQLFANTHNEEL